MQYKLRDWLFSRQRYWGEPFPVAYAADGETDGGPSIPRALPDSDLPVLLPDVDEYAPKTFAPDDRDSAPESPLARASEWTSFTEDLASDPERGWAEYVRETNTMPQWAGSCWYHLRYLDPFNTERFCDPDVERFWLGPRPEQFGPGDPGGPVYRRRTCDSGGSAASGNSRSSPQRMHTWSWSLRSFPQRGQRRRGSSRS